MTAQTKPAASKGAPGAAGLPEELAVRWGSALQARRPRVALADGADARAVLAAASLAGLGWVEPVLVGTAAGVEQTLAREGISLPPSVRVVDTGAGLDDQLTGMLSEFGVPAEKVHDPLYVAAGMLRLGRVDGVVAGATRTSADVLRAGIRLVGLKRATDSVSSSFLMILPDGRMLAYGDCAVLPDPTDVQLSQVAIATADTYAHLTGIEPVVAMLSFSTLGSADHPSVTKVRRATDLVRAARPDLLVDGELQLDSALVAAVGQAKAVHSEVAGRANVLIFPDLGAGNIGYKITERLAGATAIGPILQGLAKPLNDLSRGCSTTDIVTVALMSAMQSTEESTCL